MNRRQKALAACISFYFGCVLAIAARPVFADGVGRIEGVVEAYLKRKTLLDSSGSVPTTAIANGGTGQVTAQAGARALLDGLGTTRGSLAYRGASGWTILAPSSAGYVLTDGGVGADPSWAAAAGGTPTVSVLNKIVTPSIISNSSAETSVYSYSVPGGTLSSTNRLRLSLRGNGGNNSGGAATMRVAVYYGGSTVFDSTQNMTDGNVGGLRLDLDLTAYNGSASTQDGNGFMAFRSDWYVIKQNHISVDSTASQTLEVKITLSVADLSNTIEIDSVYLEKLNP